MSENPKKEGQAPPPGSARARLESMQRRERATAPMRRKMLMLCAFLAVLISGLAVFECRSRREASWFDFYKDSAWMARESKWEELSGFLADDLVIEGVPIKGKEELLALAKKYERKGLSLHASHPFAFGEQEDSRWMRYFLTWSRGNLEDRNVVPIVAQWLVHVRMKLKDGNWQADLAVVRPTIPSPEVGIQGEGPPEGR